MWFVLVIFGLFMWSDGSLHDRAETEAQFCANGYIDENGVCQLPPPTECRDASGNDVQCSGQ